MPRAGNAERLWFGSNAWDDPFQLVETWHDQEKCNCLVHSDGHRLTTRRRRRSCLDYCLDYCLINCLEHSLCFLMNIVETWDQHVLEKRPSVCPCASVLALVCIVTKLFLELICYAFTHTHTHKQTHTHTHTYTHTHSGNIRTRSDTHSQIPNLNVCLHTNQHLKSWCVKKFAIIWVTFHFVSFHFGHARQPVALCNIPA
jgi:hypothetical protein